jgi:uncharacterized protein
MRGSVRLRPRRRCVRRSKGRAQYPARHAPKASYPRHKAIVDEYRAKGVVIGIGPFADLGNMAIFRTREAAEAFVKEDPFILEGLVASIKIREWDDAMLE